MQIRGNSFGRNSQTQTQRKWGDRLKWSVIFASLILLGTTVFVGYQLTDQYEKVTAFYTTTMKPTLKYFDENLNANPITSIKYTQDKTDNSELCEEGYSVLNVQDYPGTVIGCLTNGKVRKGKCTSSSGEHIHATTSIQLTHWRAGYFCAKTQEKGVQGEHNFVSGEACQSGFTQCNECECFKEQADGMETCPVTGLKLSKTSNYEQQEPLWKANEPNTGVQSPMGEDPAQWDSYYEYFQHSTEQPFLIDVTVEQYGMLCKNPEEHPKKESISYNLVDRVNKGCGKFGEDDVFSVEADRDSVRSYGMNNFYTLTSDRSIDLPQFIDTSNRQEEGVFLYGRYQIQTKCDLHCRDFRFSPKADELMTQYAKAWGQIQTLWQGCLIFASVALMYTLVLWLQQKKNNTQKKENFVFGIVLVCFVAYWLFHQTLTTAIFCFCGGLIILFVIKQKPAQTTQQQLLLTFVWCFVGFMFVVYMSYSTYQYASTTYKHTQNQLLRAEQQKCILDEGWAGVLKSFNKKTNLKQFSENLQYTAYVFGAFCIGYGFLLYSALQQLGKSRQYNTL